MPRQGTRNRLGKCADHDVLKTGNYLEPSIANPSGLTTFGNFKTATGNIVDLSGTLMEPTYPIGPTTCSKSKQTKAMELQET